IFWREIAFTLHSFVAQTGAQQGVRSIILFGGGSAFKGLSTFVTESLGIKTELFEVELLIHDGILTTNHKNGLNRATLLSASVALPLSPGAECSLRQKELTSDVGATLFTKQFIASVLLVLFLFG